MTWRFWQKEVIDTLNTKIEQKDTRAVFWVWEETGNVGKSFLCDYLCEMMDAVMLNGRAQDVLYAYKGEPIVCIDAPREQREFMGGLLGAVESLRNGRIFSGKYNSVARTFDPPQVLIFANFPPIREAFSADRLIEYHIPVRSARHHVVFDDEE